MKNKRKYYVAFLGLIMMLGACKPKSTSTNERASDQKQQMATTLVSPQDTQDGSACQQGLQAAKVDEAKGIIGYYFWGIAIPPVAHRLKEKYGFTIYAMGCTSIGAGSKAWTCYNAYMDKVIQKKYKQDVIALEMAADLIEVK